jgi:hypothetical protein
MSKFKELRKIFINHPTDDKENKYQTDCDFSNHSLEELKAEGEELWERSRQEDPERYRRLDEWLDSKSLDNLVKLYGEVVTSDFDVTASSKMERDSP